MVGALGPANVIYGDVGDNFLHCGKLFQTGRARLELLSRLRGQKRLRVHRGRVSRMSVLLVLLQVLVGVVGLVRVVVLVVAVGGLLVRGGGAEVAGRLDLGGGGGGGAAARIGRRVLLLGGCGGLSGGQLRLLLLLQLQRQLHPETGVGALRLALAGARVCRDVARLLARRLLLLLLLRRLLQVPMDLLHWLAVNETGLHVILLRALEQRPALVLQRAHLLLVVHHGLLLCLARVLEEVVRHMLLIANLRLRLLLLLLRLHPHLRPLMGPIQMLLAASVLLAAWLADCL